MAGLDDYDVRNNPIGAGVKKAAAPGVGLIKGLASAKSPGSKYIDAAKQIGGDVAASGNRIIDAKMVGSATRAGLGAIASIPGAIKGVYDDNPARDAVSMGMSNFMEGFSGAQAGTPPQDIATTGPGATSPMATSGLKDGGAIPEGYVPYVAGENDRTVVGDDGGITIHGDGRRLSAEAAGMPFPAAQPGIGMIDAINPAPANAPGLDAQVIRGTQSGAADPDYDVYTEGPYDKETARAVSAADSIRRNVFSTPGESDAMAIAKRRGADSNAQSMLSNVTKNKTDKERIAADKALGLATLGVRKAEIAGRETVANIRAEDNSAMDYTEMLKQKKSLTELQYADAFEKAQAMEEGERKQRFMEALQESNYDLYMQMTGGV